MVINDVFFNEVGTFHKEGKRYTYHCVLVGSYTRTEVGAKLIGMGFHGQKILGVEMYAIENQINQPIGILVEREIYEDSRS